MTNAEFGIEPTSIKEIVEGLRREREGINPGNMVFVLMTMAADRLEAAENGLQYWNGIKADNEKLKSKLAAAEKRIEELEKALQDVAPSHHALEEPQS